MSTLYWCDDYKVKCLIGRPANEASREGNRAETLRVDAGTLVVWDVDVLRAEVILVYRATDPARPRVHRRGEIADAEPAVPGWRLPVDDLFA